MKLLTTGTRRRLAVAVALGALLFPLAAGAQDLPSYANAPAVSTDETIHGRIASVDGAFAISVNDDRGFIDNIALHQGTIINPTGLSLAPGMSVTIVGYNAGSVFNANEIDTPYSYTGAVPVPVYYGPGYWYPGFGYGYGPSFTLAIVFGGGYRFEHHHFYGRAWDGRHYFGGYVGYGGYGARRYLSRAGAGFDGHAYARGPGAFAGRSFAGRPYAEHVGRAGVDGERSFATRSYPARTGDTARTFGARNYPEHGFARAGGVASSRGFASSGGFARAGGYARGGFGPAGGYVRGGGAPAGAFAGPRGAGVARAGGFAGSGMRGGFAGGAHMGRR